MKTTGIVRRIDDLGRIVIPKETRRILKIREGDPIEMFIDDEQVIFKKYSVLKELTDFSQQFADILYRTEQLPVIVCDMDRVVAVAGIAVKEVVNRPITQDVFDMIKNRKIYVYERESGLRLHAIMEDARFVIAGAPIATDTDTFGAIMFLSEDGKSVPFATEADTKLIQAFAAYISQQLLD